MLRSAAKKRSSRSTIADVAEISGVSKAVVSQVLLGRSEKSTTRFSQATAYRVRKIAESLHYRPSLAGRVIHEGRTGMLGIVLPSNTGTYLNGMLSSCLAKARELGYELIVGMAEVEKPDYLDRISTMLDRDVDGVILFPSHDFENSRLHSELLNSQRAAILVEHNVNSNDLDFVGMDNRTSYKAVIEYLKELGHERIGLVYEDEQLIPSAYKRRLEFEQAIDEADLPVLPRDYYQTRMEPSKNDLEHIVKGVGDYTALVVRGDNRACHIYESLTRRGIVVPQQLSMVVISGRDYSRDRLLFTSMRTAVEQIGSRAVELLVERLRQPSSDVRTILIPATLHIGQTSCSCGK